MSQTQSDVLQLLISALSVVAREGYLKQADSTAPLQENCLKC